MSSHTSSLSTALSMCRGSFLDASVLAFISVCRSWIHDNIASWVRVLIFFCFWCWWQGFHFLEFLPVPKSQWRLFASPLVVWQAPPVLLCVLCLCLAWAFSVAPSETSVSALILFAHLCLFVLPWRKVSWGVSGPLDPLRTCCLSCEYGVSPPFGWKRRLLHLLVMFLGLWCSCALKKLCLTPLFILYSYSIGSSIGNALGTSRAEILCCSVVQRFSAVTIYCGSWLPCQWGRMVACYSYAFHIGKQKLKFLGWHLIVWVVTTVSLLAVWACTTGAL